MSVCQHQDGRWQVKVSIGGVERFAYFRNPDAAHALDAEWRAEQQQLRRKRPTATAISGITVNFYTQNRKTKDGLIKTYYAPVIRVQVIGPAGKSRKVFSVTKLGLDGAWEAAMAFYAEWTGTEFSDELLELKPHPEQFRRIRRHMNRDGHLVPASKLPV